MLGGGATAAEADGAARMLMALQESACRWLALMIEATKELSAEVDVLEQGWAAA